MASFSMIMELVSNPCYSQKSKEKALAFDETKLISFDSLTLFTRDMSDALKVMSIHMMITG
jgi:hypothetical protein